MAGAAVRLTGDEARAVMLAAQGLLDPPPPGPDGAAVRATVERLGVVQLDAISVVARTQYLVLWSRLGPYQAGLLDALLYPQRAVFEYWGHAASILPMADYPYYRPRMRRAAEHVYGSSREWLAGNPAILDQTLATIRERGPLASADFERPPDARRTGPWDWYGPKESRRALHVLWTDGRLMIHSRRAGQRVYDLAERVLAEAGLADLDDGATPAQAESYRHFIGRTVAALGVATPAWLDDYFRLSSPDGTVAGRRAAQAAALADLARAGAVVPAEIEGLPGPAYLHAARLGDLERHRAGHRPAHTTLLTPFDSLIWHRERARTLFGYEVCFEAYVVPERRRYGYYCLAILHDGRLVGRIDPKFERSARRLLVRALYLEPGVAPDAGLLDGLAEALASLARFLGAQTVTVERSEPDGLAPALAERVGAL